MYNIHVLRTSLHFTLEGPNCRVQIGAGCGLMLDPHEVNIVHFSTLVIYPVLMMGL